jgi:uncharacterized FlaG/YvyC family protein
MLSVGNAGLGSGATLSLDVRAAAGASVLAANANSSSASAETTASPDAVTHSLPEQRAPAYNSIEFIYRQDYGKVILREQNAETGQEVTQIPSEYHLQQYAATQRAQRVHQQATLYHLESGGGQPQPRTGVGTKATVSGGTTGRAAVPVSTGQSAPAPAPVPAAAAPAAPVVTAAAAAPAHVDIKV